MTVLTHSARTAAIGMLLFAHRASVTASVEMPLCAAEMRSRAGDRSHPEDDVAEAWHMEALTSHAHFTALRISPDETRPALHFDDARFNMEDIRTLNDLREEIAGAVANDKESSTLTDRLLEFLYSQNPPRYVQISSRLPNTAEFVEADLDAPLLSYFAVRVFGSEGIPEPAAYA